MLYYDSTTNSYRVSVGEVINGYSRRVEWKLTAYSIPGTYTFDSYYGAQNFAQAQASVPVTVINNPPNPPTSLTQYKSDGITGIPLGGTTTESTVVMKGGVSDPDGNNVQLEVEIRPVGTSFTNTPTCTSGLVPSGSTASAICSGLASGQYHWQARAAKDSYGATGSWLSAGGNPESSPDFVVDITLPTVIGNTPTGSNVPVNTQITVTFSEAMNQASAQSAFSTSPATTGSFSWSGNTMTYTPSSNLAYSTTYTATVGTGAKDLAGNNLQSPYSWQFSTASAPDTTPPTITGNTPTGSNVPVNTQITVTFSEAMNQASAQSAFSTSPATTGSFSWSGNTMTYTPSSNLAYSTTYTVTIGTGAKDLAGNSLQSSYSWQFSTASAPDTTPPTITGNTPAGSNVPVNTQITVTFSEAMNQASAQSAFSTSPSTTGSFSWSGNTMTYTPSSNLAYSTAYTVTIGTGAKDLAGNSLQSPYSWQFSTTSAPTLSVGVSESPDPVTSGGTSQVSVHVTSGGMPVSGANVHLNTSGGSLSPADGNTSAGGSFNSSYTAPSVTTTQTYLICATATKTGYTMGTACDTITVNPIPLQGNNTISITDISSPPAAEQRVPIIINNATGIGSVGLRLSYNASVVRAYSDPALDKGDFPDFYAPDNINNASGYITINTYKMGGSLTGNPVVGYVRLRAVGNIGDSSTLILSDIVLTDESGNDLSYAVHNGTFTIEANDTTPPGVSNPTAINIDTGEAHIPDDTDSDPMWGEKARLNVTVIDDVIFNNMTVTINLSAIGGSPVQPMTNIGGNIWSVVTNASAGKWGLYNLTVTATDAYGNINNSVAVSLRVIKNGDVNGNGAVSIGDALLLANNVSYPGRYPIAYRCAADVNGNGVINIGDASRLAGNISFPGNPLYILK